MKELLESRPDPSSQKSRRRREPLRDGVEESCGVGPVDDAVVEAQRERQVASVLNLADPSDAEDRDLEPPSDTERMIVQASEELAKRVGAGDHDVLFAGIGVSHIAAYAYQQSTDVQDVDKVPLLVEAGIYGFEAESDDAYVFPTAALPSAKVISNTTFALGAVMGSPGASTLAVLSGAEVDCEGNVNSNRLRGEYFLGSGGGERQSVHGRRSRFGAGSITKSTGRVRRVRDRPRQCSIHRCHTVRNTSKV